MAIDYSVFDKVGGISKGKPQIEHRRDKRLDGGKAERECRAEVWRLYGKHCGIPGCRDAGIHQHHIVYRSRSRKLKYDPHNRVPLCQKHHQLLHLGKIEILPRDAAGELVIKGERKYLEFKL